MGVSGLKNKERDTSSSFYVLKRTVGAMLKLIMRHKKIYLLFQILDMLFVIAKPFVPIIFTPLLIDELLGARRIRLLIIYAAAITAGECICTLGINIMRIAEEKAGIMFDNLIAEQISRRVMELDFQLTEDKNALDQIEKARTGMSWYSGGVHGVAGAFFSIISAAVRVIGTAGVIVFRAPLLIPITVLLIAAVDLLQKKINKIEIESFKNLSKVNRIFSYLFFEITGVKNGKDIRVYGAEDMMLNKAREYNEGSLRQWDAQLKAQLPHNELISVCDCVRDAANYFTAGFLAVTGKITIGVFSQIITAASELHQSVRSVVISASELTKRCSYAYEYIKFMEYPPALAKGNKKVGNGGHTIEFRGVSFTYPNTDVTALKNVSITLHPNERLSLVGLNGAGKTTFIKLLCRLYDVSGGEILLDGVNIAEYDYEEYMDLFSVVFQDFRLFAFSIGDNVSLGRDDKERVQKYVQLAGADGDFEQGTDTVLFKQFDENGIEPSGGQQQKIAIARALYKDSPVIILDEPTAALDPLAEYEIYNSFDKLVGGKTAVYISHRLSSCRFCDRIAVFSDGQIKEIGTHEELVNKPNGIYAEMFAAQAQYYN